ncbi:GNAT family N-acetyltransferase [Lacticaseibacillus mingshuiensis]|uniref:GNAT family N-acetyltransferase n=1 Tax=Lacticaseibacillus mingshuiensis TaxID=2799574 RepID=UPI00194F15B5|nr:GNAT family N-acetyltransferase [Lacticaseibacillus mingshuiensis]
MTCFEKYHPLLSAHYTMDWLTMAKLKDVFALRNDPLVAAISGRERDSSIEATAHYVNQSMRLVMADRALLYGVTARDDRSFCGSFCLWNFSENKTQAQIRFEVLAAQASRPVMAEVLPRMLGFAFFELGVTQVYALLPETATADVALLKANHFTATSTGRTRTMPDGQSVPLLKLTLAADTVKNDPRYQF